MVTTNKEFYQRDYGLSLEWTLYQSDGTTPFDLTGYTVKLKMWVTGYQSILTINGNCSIISPTNGTVSYTPAINDFASCGEYTAEFEATATGIIVTFSQFKITILPSP